MKQGILFIVLMFLLAGCTDETPQQQDKAAVKDVQTKALEENVVAKSNNTAITKDDLGRDVNYQEDSSVLIALKQELIYREAVAEGIEPDISEGEKYIKEQKEKYEVGDKEAVESHNFWMDQYNLKGEEYWDYLKKQQMKSDVIFQYLKQEIDDYESLEGAELKEAINTFTDENFEEKKDDLILNSKYFAEA
ncbi:DUF3053 family protein [Pseudalkalibacillus caeni]|uniref:DUF3053 domain-containing protein n=1 Tax=Exobacillus caeni TaxID=2574798 RepID=A0A5R9EW92_9BACL|nr:DUF3053 family protein [Pseudalkalibacillus caeni]TLS35071.1 DUF3053 domain-containing protein [Pseudalkalibacillus caeni]